MRRISKFLAIAVSALLPVSICLAQQTTPTTPANSERPGSSTPPPGPVLGGDGTPYYIPIWRTNSYLLDSVIYQTSAGSVGIGTVSPGVTLDVNGGINAAATYSITGTTVLSAPPPGNLDVGLDAGQGGSFNTFLGWDAGKANAGAFNIFIGASSGWPSPGGENNIAIGYATALTVNGDGNIMIGQNAGGQITSGGNNTFVGNNAGYYASTGSGNTYIGNGAGMGETSHTGSNNIFIKNAGTSFDVNTTRIGQSQSSAYIAGVYHATVINNALPVYVDSNGQLGTMVSSRRFKEQVRDMGDSTDALMKLRPVTFLYKPEYDKGDRTLQYGLIGSEDLSGTGRL
jgi:hypothetical protein